VIRRGACAATLCALSLCATLVTSWSPRPHMEIVCPRTPHHQDGRQGTTLPARRHAGRGGRDLRRLLAARIRRLPAALRFGGRRTDRRDPTGYRGKFVWHSVVKGVGPGQPYGYEGRGSLPAGVGLRFNEAKLLLPYDFRPGAGELVPDTRDNTGIVPKTIVIDDNAFDWQGDSPPDLGLEGLIIHKVHVKGLTAPLFPRAIARHVSGVHRENPVLAAARRQHRLAAARTPVLRGRLPDRARADQLLGLQLDRLLRPGVLSATT
jgi:hypothetical protein